MTWGYAWAWLIWPALVAALLGGGGIVYARWLFKHSPANGHRD